VNGLARVVSVVFHPLLIPTYLFALLGFYFPLALYPINGNTLRAFLILVFAMTFILPALNIFFFTITGSIQSVQMKNRKERVLPFLLIFLLYVAVTFLMFYKVRVSADDSLMKFFFIIDALVLASFVITLFYKVSVHALAMAGLLGILLPLAKVSEDGQLFIPLLFSLVINGSVMSARLQLSAHTPREVFTGAVIGFSIGFASMIILF
jgi:membrane-associated phospholipid phosphatase